MKQEGFNPNEDIGSAAANSQFVRIAVDRPSLRCAGAAEGQSSNGVAAWASAAGSIVDAVCARCRGASCRMWIRVAISRLSALLFLPVRKEGGCDTGADCE